jgi:hypothetical protein
MQKEQQEMKNRKGKRHEKEIKSNPKARKGITVYDI